MSESSEREQTIQCVEGRLVLGCLDQLILQIETVLILATPAWHKLVTDLRHPTRLQQLHSYYDRRQQLTSLYKQLVADQAPIAADDAAAAADVNDAAADAIAAAAAGVAQAADEKLVYDTVNTENNGSINNGLVNDEVDALAEIADESVPEGEENVREGEESEHHSRSAESVSSQHSSDASDSGLEEDVEESASNRVVNVNSHRSGDLTSTAPTERAQQILDMVRQQVQFVVRLTQTTQKPIVAPLTLCRENRSEPIYRGYQNGAARNLVQQLYTLRNQIRNRLCRQPAEDHEEIEQHREIWRKDLANEKLENDLARKLNSLREKQIEERRKTLQKVTEIKETIDRIRKEAQQKIDEIAENEYKKIAVETVEYRLQVNKFDLKKQRCQADLEELCLQNRISETALEDKRRKTEQRLADWVARYDDEMLPRQHELDRLQEEYNDQVEERERYEHEMAAMAQQYKRVLQKRHEREAVAEMQATVERKKMAARTILKHWRNFKLKRNELRKLQKTNKKGKTGRKRKSPTKAKGKKKK